MTIAEYELRMEAYNPEQVEEQYDAATSAWMNRNAQAFDKDSNAVSIDFNDFFNKQEIVDQVRSTFELDYKPLSGKSKQNHTSKQDIMIKRIKEYQKLHPRKETTNEQ